jgi:hypothetical protein
MNLTSIQMMTFHLSYLIKMNGYSEGMASLCKKISFKATFLYIHDTYATLNLFALLNRK